jgi:hypothetical protein
MPNPSRPDTRTDRELLELAAKGVCKHCPFKGDSRMVYDADATEALEEGYEPSCHAKVGTNAIFCDQPPVHRCHGHDLWLDGHPGYRQPATSTLGDQQ